MSEEINLQQAPRCRSCGDLILWAVTEHGKRMPVNVPHDPNGNIILEYAGDGSDPVARYVSVEPSLLDADEKRWTSHFATCPQALQWRKK